jgi:putative MFS transporter
MFSWIPSLLVARGLSESTSNTYFFISTIAQIPGYFSAAWLVERWGRRPTLALYLVGTGVSAILFGNAGSGGDVILYAALLSFFNLGAWGVLYTITPEQYPTVVRATGSGAAAAVGRLGGIIGPFLTPVLAPSIGQPAVFALFMALLVIAAVDVLVLAEETRGRSLEEIAGQAAA